MVTICSDENELLGSNENALIDLSVTSLYNRLFSYRPGTREAQKPSSHSLSSKKVDYSLLHSA